MVQVGRLRRTLLRPGRQAPDPAAVRGKGRCPDPSDIVAMKRFQSEGGTIVAGLSNGEWINVKRAGAVKPAGQICPTAKPYSADPNAKPVDLIPEAAWTEA